MSFNTAGASFHFTLLLLTFQVEVFMNVHTGMFFLDFFNCVILLLIFVIVCYSNNP